MSQNKYKFSDMPKAQRWFHDKSQADSESIVITLWPYRSLSLGGFRILIAVLTCLMSLIGLGFYLIGAWPILGFFWVWRFSLSGMPLNGITDRDSLWKQLQLCRSRWISREQTGGAIQKTICLNGLWIKAELDTKEKKKCRLYLRQHANKLEVHSCLPQKSLPWPLP